MKHDISCAVQGLTGNGWACLASGTAFSRRSPVVVERLQHLLNGGVLGHEILLHTAD